MVMVLPLDPNLGKPKKLLDQVRDVMRLKHYSLRTERTYCDWIERFIRFHELRHPRELGEGQVSAFLTHLAREGKVAASTQNQALSALLFLYKEVLKQEIGWLENVERAKKPARLPVVLTRDEVNKIFAQLQGTARLMAGLLCLSFRAEARNLAVEARITQSTWLDQSPCGRSLTSVRDDRAPGCQTSPTRFQSRRTNSF